MTVAAALTAAPPSPTASASSTSTSSLYTTPPHTPLRRRAPETILDASSPRVQQLDIDLDAASTPPRSPASSCSQSSIFDSEQLSVHSDPSPPPSPSPPTPPQPQPQPQTQPQPHTQPPQKHAAPRASFLSRASQTFYAAFRRPAARTSQPPVTAKTSSSSSASTSTRPVSQLLDAQLSALRAAKAGFVDLSVLVALTQRTLNAINQDALPALQAHKSLRVRCAMLASKASSNVGNSDIADKERLLVQAKLSAAEASDCVERLKHELHVTKRQLALPQRVKTRTKRQLTTQALVIREARAAVEHRLQHAKQVRASERAALRRAEGEYRDIQGDWA